MNITSETIEKFKEFVFKGDKEICANLRKESDTNNNLKLYYITEGTTVEYAPGKTRGMCVHDKITSVIFHTHPITSYSYPSVEDILRVVREHGRIVRSIIATKWGVWDIKNTEKSNVYSSTCKNIIEEYIRYFLEKILHVEINLYLWDELTEGMTIH